MSKAYRESGVNIEAGYEAVERMKKHVARTTRKGMMGSIGSFGGMFDLSSLALKEPVLVSGTDGVGTKLKLAFMMDKHDTIGMDCVAMCVNDIVVQGAEPLFFLDYIACGKAIPEKIEQIVKGIADGCEQAGCAIVGGETAEMPGLYDENEYDLAGFTVGACEKKDILTGEAIRPGQVLVGLSSSGIHSNGYSLVRKICFEDQHLSLDESFPELEQTLGEALLTPTKIYVKPVLEALKKCEIKGISHITGGGFVENIPRMIPNEYGIQIDEGSWPIPAIFTFLEDKGQLERRDMYSVFNMGIGMVMAVEEGQVHQLLEVLERNGEKAFVIGSVTEQSGIQWGKASE